MSRSNLILPSSLSVVSVLSVRSVPVRSVPVRSVRSVRSVLAVLAVLAGMLAGCTEDPAGDDRSRSDCADGRCDEAPACPAAFVAGHVAGGAIVPQSDPMIGDYLGALAPIAACEDTNAIVVAIANDAAPGTYDLATSLATLTPPSVGAGYHLDFATYESEKAYIALSGSLTLHRVCADDAGTVIGVQGLATDLLFNETVDGHTPIPLEDGCQMSVPFVSFAIGACLANP